MILNAVGTAMSDENGYVQAEITHDTNSFEIVKGELNCEASFVNPRTESLIIQLGTLKCL